MSALEALPKYMIKRVCVSKQVCAKRSLQSGDVKNIERWAKNIIYLQG